MDRRTFVGSTAGAAMGLTLQPFSPGNMEKREFYEWREYEMRFGTSHASLHRYLEKVLIPALNRQGVNHVGAFREIGKSEPPRFYLLIAYSSFEQFITIGDRLSKDEEYEKGCVEYNNIEPAKAPYRRICTSLMIAFEGLPVMKGPETGQRIFEVRTYEGHNEDAVKRKIRMFNEEEFDIFYRTGLHPVYFGEVISGKNLPCLQYMLRFRDMKERDDNWAAFGADAAWKKVSADPQYANTVSNIIRVFLEPLAYSQI